MDDYDDGDDDNVATARWMTKATTAMATIAMDGNVDNNGDNDDDCDGGRR